MRRGDRRMMSGLIRVLVLGSLVSLAAGVATSQGRAADLLAKKLADFPGADRGQVIAVMEPYVSAAFSNYHFYLLRSSRPITSSW